MSAASHAPSCPEATAAPPSYEEDDRQLETALDALDSYQALRAIMDKHLKTAFFDLARAKQALGPARVGPASFNLGRIEPVVTVDVLSPSHSTSASTLTSDVQYSLRQAIPYKPVETEKGGDGGKSGQKAIGKGKGKGRVIDGGGVVDLRMAASTSALSLNDGLEERLKSSLRARPEKAGSGSELSEKSASASTSSRESKSSTGQKDRRITSSSNKTAIADSFDKNGEDASPPPTYSEATNEFTLDPIQQFSAFPPPTLRNAQNEFRRALEQGVKVMAVQNRFADLCRTAGESKSAEVSGKQDVSLNQ